MNLVSKLRVLEVSAAAIASLALLSVIAAGNGTESDFCGFNIGQTIDCPCMSGALTSGCPNSANSGGVHLYASGSFSTLADTTTFLATGLPTNSMCMLLQGTERNGGVLFGDGL